MIAIMHDVSDELKKHYEDFFSESILIVNAELTDSYPDVEVLVSEPRVSIDFLSHFPNLKLIFTFSSSVNRMPFNYIKEKNIILTNSKGLHTEHMSEHALAMILAHTRQLDLAIKRQEEHKWSQGEGTFTTVHGKSLCIVGAGSIGSALARKASAMGMTVTGVSRSGKENSNYQKMYQQKDLKIALPDADVVVLLTPLTHETHHLFDADIFAAMKKQSVFINISRGETVDETALIEALTNGTLIFAGLDVFQEEPIGESSIFWGMPNVLITPHTAGDIDDYFERALMLFSDVFADFKTGKAVRNRVDLDLGY